MLRHGAVEGRASVFRGLTDRELSAAGVAQMEAFAARFSDASLPRFDKVVSSSLARCRVPAERFAQLWGVPLVVKDELREMDFGEWEELSPAEVAARWPERIAAFYENPQHTGPPGGETFDAFSRRIVASFQQGYATRQADNVLLVIHAGVMRALLAYLLGLDARQAMRFDIRPGGFCRLTVPPDGAAMLNQLSP